MRKIMLLCVLVLALGVFVGCQNRGDGDDIVTIEFWNMFTGGDGEFMIAMIDDFMEQHPHIRVNHLSMLEADYYSRLPAAIAVGDAPDVAIVHSSRLADIMRINNALLPLNEFNISWNRYPTALVESAVFDGNHIALPLDLHPLIMFYNRDLLGPAGLLRADGTPDFDIGLDSFVDFLVRFQAANSDAMPLAATNITSNFPTWVWWFLYNQQGGEFLTPDGSAAAFDNPQALRALQVMYDWMYLYEVQPEGIRSGQEQFVANNAAIAFAGVWTVGMILDSGIDAGIMPIPQLFDRHVTWGDSHTFVIPQQSSDDNYDAAVTFITWISQNSFEWANAGHIPAYAGVAESAEFNALPLRSDYVMSRDLVVFYPQNENILGIITAIRAEIEMMQTGQATPEQTLTRMIEGVNAALQN